MFKHEIKYGVITGIGICIWIFAEYLLGFHTNRMNIGEYTLCFVLIIPTITIYLGIKEKRDMEFSGLLSLGNGIKTGLMISFIAAAITAVFIIVYFNYIDPGFFERGIAYRRERLLLKEKSNVEFIEQLRDIKAAFSFVNQLLFGILGTVGTGFIISIVLSILLKRSKQSL